MKIEEIREKFKKYHNLDGYREEHHVKMDNEAFPHTFNASGLENQIKEIIDKTDNLSEIEDKFYCIQPCFRRFDIENIFKNGYSIFFQMCGKCHITQNLVEELPEYLKKHIWFFVNEIGLDQSKLWFTIFWWGQIAKIWDTIMPKDERSENVLLKLGIPSDKIVPIENPIEKWEIDNFLVRFERDWEKYAGYWLDIYYDLWEKFQIWENDTKPGNVKWGRFLEISTTRILDYRRNSGYWESVNLWKSPMPTIVSGLSLERLAFITQWVSSVFEIDCYSELWKILNDYWYSEETNKKLIALLIPLFYILSEWNLPWWSNTWKNRDLRALCIDIFNCLDTFQRIYQLLENKKIACNRKEFFRNIWPKESSLYITTYCEIYNMYSGIYDTLTSKHKQILTILWNEQVNYVESKYKKFLHHK